MTRPREPDAIPPSPSPAFFPGFRELDVEAGGVRFGGVLGGSGPPLLLLHGYPQTHVAWRKVAPVLARRHTVVVPDLPGYGASLQRATSPRWTKRRIAAALLDLMRTLGHHRFALAGHDRGARAGYRLVLDHPGVVTRFASLAVVPTRDALAAVDHRFARRSFHWFMLAQGADLPERMLAAAPDAFLDHAFSVMGADGDAVIEPPAREAYRAAFRDPAVRHAMCEDYRSALDEDAAHDDADHAAGRKLDCPVLVLWPCADGSGGRPRDAWAAWADDVTDVTTTGGHLQPEDRPDEVATALVAFMAGSPDTDAIHPAQDTL